MEIILFVISFILIIGAQALVKGTYNKYRTIRNKKGLTGRDIARKILDKNGLTNIEVTQINGTMTDNYDPRKKVVRLSNEVYRDDSIASLAIAAHECGHAIQYKNKYLFVRIRGFLVPIVNFTSTIGYIVLVIGFLSQIFNIVFWGIALLAVTLLFQLVTLPVEFDASKKARKILADEDLIDTEEADKVKSMLSAAAMTYVASLLANLLEILRLFLMSSRRRD